MATIVTRAAKGSALTYAEVDANFTNLNNSKIETSAIGTTVQPYNVNLTEFATVNPSAIGIELITDADASSQRATLGLGTAATTASTDYATAAQGAIADSAVQPADIVNMLETSDIGVSVQAYSVNLDEYAAVNPTAAGLALLDDVDAATQRTTLGLEIGTNVQAWNAYLDTWSGKIAPTGTVVGTDDTQTLSAKRITSRIGTIADAATITPTGDNSDQYNVTALAQAATIAAPSGTPADGQKLSLRFEDNGTSRALTWTTTSGAYRAVGVTLPTATVASKVIYVGCIYNSADTFWDVVAVATQA